MLPVSHLIISCVFVSFLNIICGGSVTPTDNKCTQPIVTGYCFSFIPRYGFFSEKGRCEKFIYGGCGENENNFKSIEECFSECGGNPPTIEIGCDRTKCDWKTFGSYLSSKRECQPIYEGGQCCPTRFDCKTHSERGLDPKKCYYKGQEYENKLTVEKGTRCFLDCHCTDSRQLNSYNFISCPILDCPENFSPGKRGCRSIYEPDQCCRVGQICDEVDSDSFDCEWEGKSYKLGDEMDFTGDDECQSCVCTANFTNPRGSGCRKMDCGREEGDTTSIEMGCTSVYFEGICCPLMSICPNHDKIKVLESCKSQINDELEHCSYGEVDIKYGSTVDVIGNCQIKCRCTAPPDLSCIQYKSCEEAEQKECINKGVNETECPVINCPKGCSTTKDFKTGCDICFCSDLSYSCPEATCPSSCEDRKIEMNETSGCYECTCN